MKNIIVFALLFVGLIVIQSRDIAMASESQKAVPEGEFIDLFIKGKYDISGPATEYINACCKDREKAIQLLRDNGFGVTIASEPERVRSLNEHWRTTEEPFDEFMFGKRGPVYWRFWDIFASYRVALLLRNGKVERVWARVDRTMP